MENSMEVPQKVKNQSSMWSSNPRIGHTSRQRSPLLFKKVLENLVRQLCKKKIIQILKEEVNPLLFADDIHKSTNDFNKVAWYKINIQKSVASPEYNYEQSAREIKKTIQFTGESNRIKYQGINFERP